MHRKLGLLLVSVFTGSIISGLIAPVAQAQPAIPPNINQAQFNAGLINRYEEQRLYMQRHAPWAYKTGPLTKEDLYPEDDEPVIEFLNVDVDAKLVPSIRIDGTGQ